MSSTISPGSRVEYLANLVLDVLEDALGGFDGVARVAGREALIWARRQWPGVARPQSASQRPA